MTITHKVLVSKETGTIRSQVYEIDNPRPCALDCEWVNLTPGTAAYKHLVANEDVSHLDMDKTYWDFTAQEWVEVATTALPSLIKSKTTRNHMLVLSDAVFQTLTDPVEIQAWVTYRQQLRTMFDGLPADYDWNMLVFPRSPKEIAALKDLAAAGNVEAIAIIERDNL